jgi:hypothetical protein
MFFETSVQKTMLPTIPYTTDFLVQISKIKNIIKSRFIIKNAYFMYTVRPFTTQLKLGKNKIEISCVAA